MSAVPAPFSAPVLVLESPAVPQDSASSSLIMRLARGAAAALRRPLLAILFLVAAVFIVYLPALDAQFIWDDNFLVRDNGLIRSPIFVLEAFRHTLFGGQSNFYRPSQTLVYIADYWLGGNQPFIYHFTSILIHALNGVLLYLLLRWLLPSLLPHDPDVDQEKAVERRWDLLALLLALVWALYPVHSATVDYISGSADSLAMLFSCLAWLGANRCLHARSRSGTAAWATAAGGCLLAAFCSKEIAFVWLVLFALHLFFFSQARDIVVRRKLSLVAGSLLVLTVYVALRHIPTVPVMPPNGQVFSRGIMALRALGDYGSLLVFPGRLLMERQVYPAPHSVLTDEDRLFYGSLTAGGVLLLAVFAAGVVWRGSGRRLRSFGVCWFLCGFLPVSNLFVTINATVAEHWLYLPSIGFLLFAAGCAWQIPTRRLRVGALALALIAATAFGVRTYWRAFDWMDEFTFYRQTVSAGGDVPRARVGFANAYSHRKEDAAAIVLLRQAVVDMPNDLSAQANLANALGRQGRREEAKPILEKIFSRAEQAEPRLFLIILANLDVLEKEDPRWPALRDKALTRQRQAHPDSWDLVQYDISTMHREGQPAQALRQVQAYAQAHWWHYPSWYLLGSLCAEAGDTARAVRVFEQASRLDVHDAQALSSAAQVRVGEGQIAEATVLQREAVDRQPENPRQRIVLSQILEAASQPVEAAQQVAIASTLLSGDAHAAP